MPGVRVANVPLFRYHKPPLFFLGCPSFKTPEPSEAAELSEQSASRTQQQQQLVLLPVPDTRASRSACFFPMPRLLRPDWLVRLSKRSTIGQLRCHSYSLNCSKHIFYSSIYGMLHNLSPFSVISCN